MTLSNGDVEMSDSNFSKLRAIVHKHTGITIGDNRKNLLLSRLRSHLRETGEASFKSYIDRVSTDAEVLQELVNRVTTNKTYFYRTPRIWEHFCDVAQPAFSAKKPKRPMRIWSAAASTGEEAHTVGILMEEVRKTETDFDYAVVGTDVSSRVLAVAETGCYAPAAVTQFRKEKPEVFNAHMKANDDGQFNVSPAIRARLRFKLHNLQERLKNTSPFDAVFLRNVLIYFTPEDQENILRNVRALMPPDGVLYIGESETLTRLNTDFEMEAPMVYRPASNSAGSTA